eukprot:8399915-Alexandrium_andersonii.AAC.1
MALAKHDEVRYQRLLARRTYKGDALSWYRGEMEKLRCYRASGETRRSCQRGPLISHSLRVGNARPSRRNSARVSLRSPKAHLEV